MLDVYNHELRLYADPSRVVVRPFHLSWQANGSGPSRAQRLVDEVLEMDNSAARAQLELVLRDFEERHWQTRRVFMTRYEEIQALLKDRGYYSGPLDGDFGAATQNAIDRLAKKS